MSNTVHTIAELNANIDASYYSHRAASEAYDRVLAEIEAVAEQLRDARAVVATLEELDAELMPVMRDAYKLREATDSVMKRAYRRRVLNAPSI
mgnify:CR=1 FL=1